MDIARSDAVRLLRFSFEHFEARIVSATFRAAHSADVLSTETIAEAAEGVWIWEEALAAIAHALGPDFLIRAVEDDGGAPLKMQRKTAVKLLRWFEGPVTTEVVRAALEDSDSYVRLWARLCFQAWTGERPWERKMIEPFKPSPFPTFRLDDPLDDEDLAILATILQRRALSDREGIASLTGHKTLGPLAVGLLEKEGAGGVDAILSRIRETGELPHGERLELLARSGDPAVVDVLIEVGERGKEQLHGSPATSPAGRGFAIRALARFPGLDRPDIIARLIDLLDESRYVSAVTTALEGIGGKAVVSLLGAYAEDGPIRRKHATVVAKACGPAAMPALLNALEDRFREVREEAADGLVALGEDAVPAVAELVEDAPEEQSRRALDVLGRIGGAGAIAVLLEATKSPRLRVAALESLGRCDTPEVHRALAAALLESDTRVQRAAWASLTRYRQRWGWDESAARSFAEAFRTALDSPNADVAREAIEHLAKSYRPTGGLALTGGEGTRSADDGALESFLMAARTDTDTAVRWFRSIFADPIRDELLSQALTQARGDDRKALERLSEAASEVRRKRQEKRPVSPSRDHGGDRTAVYSIGDSGPELRRSKTIKEPLARDVQFSVTAPLTVQPGAAFILGFWVHDSLNRHGIVRMGTEQQRGGPTHVTTKGGVSLKEGTTLEVALSIPAFGAEDLTDTVYWSGRGVFGNCTFPVRVPRSAEEGVCFGRIVARVGGHTIGKVDFTLEVADETSDVADVTGSVNRVATAFASYASTDRERVMGRIQGMLKVLPDLDVFVDVVSLRSGEDWERRIAAEIVDRDVFLLFWSSSASESKWVRDEIRYATAHKSLDAIWPVPLQPPSVVPPPAELGSLHFNDWTLAFE